MSQHVVVILIVWSCFTQFHSCDAIDSSISCDGSSLGAFINMTTMAPDHAGFPVGESIHSVAARSHLMAVKCTIAPPHLLREEVSTGPKLMTSSADSVEGPEMEEKYVGSI